MQLSTCTYYRYKFDPRLEIFLCRNISNYISLYLDKTKATSPGAEEGNSPRDTFGVLDVWRKYRVDSNKVNEWTANLRLVRIEKVINIHDKYSLTLVYI